MDRGLFTLVVTLGDALAGIGQAIALLEPLSEIDQPAALAAERELTPWAGVHPGRGLWLFAERLPTDRTGS
jgi:hypothetical protein